jgi:hypothetical protein
MNTTSEQRFLEYCAHRGYTVQAIERQPNVQKTADFRVVAGGCELIVEVKELVAPPESLRIASTSPQASQGSGGDGRLFERVRHHVWEAAKQLRPYRTEARPSAIVLYDNVRDGRVRRSEAYSEMGDREIEAAMFGEQGGAERKSTERAALARNEAGGRNGAFAHGVRPYVSAVCVLYDIGDISLRTYHNFYARVPLPLAVFAGPGDFHLKKSKDPKLAVSSWIDCARTA